MEINKIVIISKEENETNECRNGGKHHHSLSKFLFKDVEGVFHDTSCGRLGRRYYIDWNGLYFSINELYGSKSYSTKFNESHRNEIKILNEFFNINILTNDEIYEDFLI